MARKRNIGCSYKRGNTGFNTTRKFRSAQTRHTKMSKNAEAGIAILTFLCGGLF